MKKFLLLFFSLWLALFADAQITRSIWGLTLGVSTVNEVRTALRERGYAGQMTEDTDVPGVRTITVEAYPIRFGGYDWTRVSFSIKNGLFYSVAFSYSVKSSALVVAKNLYSSLYRKYSRYQLDKYPGDVYNKYELGYGHELILERDFAVCFRDGRTEIILDHCTTTNIYRNANRKEVKYGVSLIYSDSNLGGAGGESDL